MLNSKNFFKNSFGQGTVEQTFGKSLIKMFWKGLSKNSGGSTLGRSLFGQGTVEYLILLAVIVVIALFAVFVVFNLNDSSVVESNSERISKSVSDFSVVDDFYLSEGDYFLSFRGVMVGGATINSIRVGDSIRSFFSNNFIDRGVDRTFVINSSESCIVGEKVSRDVVINFTDGRGSIKEFSDKFSFICSSVVVPDSAKLASSSTSVDCFDLNNNGDLNTTVCNDSNHPCVYTIYCNEIRGGVNLGVEDVRVNGFCGDNNGGSFATLSSSNPGNCSSGTVASFSSNGSGWTWSCDGEKGGTNASCSAFEGNLEILEAVAGFREDSEEYGVKRHIEMYFIIKNNFSNEITITNLDINAINVNIELESNPKQQELEGEYDTGVAECLYENYYSLSIGFSWATIDSVPFTLYPYWSDANCLTSNPSFNLNEELIIYSGGSSSGAHGSGYRMKGFIPIDPSTGEPITDDTTAGPYLIKVTYLVDGVSQIGVIETDIEWKNLNDIGVFYHYVK
jgi:hypothetical protein